MSERTNVCAPTEFTCPGCEEPLVKGSTTRSVCDKEGAVALNQENDLANELRSALVIPKDFSFSDLLEPEFHSIFARIVNQLDPRSFANLARTSKATHELCFSSKDIEINYDLGWIMVSTMFDSLRFKMLDVKSVREKNDEFRPPTYCGKKFGFLGSAENRKKLQKYPFVLKLKKLYIRGPLSFRSIVEIRLLLAEFKIKKISEIYTERIDDWGRFVKLVQDFGMKRVDALFVSLLQRIRFMGPAAAIRSGPPQIPGKVATFFLQNMEHFHCNINIPDRLLLEAPVKTVRLTKTEISKETFVALLERFANSTEEVNWRLGTHDDFDFEHYNVFKTAAFSRKGALPAERPLILTTSDEDVFKVLRKDGKYLLVYRDGPNVVFSTSANRNKKPDYDEYDTDDEVAGELENAVPDWSMPWGI